MVIQFYILCSVLRILIGSSHLLRPLDNSIKRIWYFSDFWKACKMRVVHIIICWSSVALIYGSDLVENSEEYYFNDDNSPTEEYDSTEQNNLTQESADYSRADEDQEDLSKEAGIRLKLKNKFPWITGNITGVDILWPHGKPGSQTNKKPNKKTTTVQPVVSVTTTGKPLEKITLAPVDLSLDVTTIPPKNWFLVGITTPPEVATDAAISATPDPPKTSNATSVETFQISLVGETSQEVTTAMPRPAVSVVEMNPSSGEIPSQSTNLPSSMCRSGVHRFVTNLQLPHLRPTRYHPLLLQLQPRRNLP